MAQSPPVMQFRMQVSRIVSLGSSEGVSRHNYAPPRTDALLIWPNWLLKHAFKHAKTEWPLELLVLELCFLLARLVSCHGWLFWMTREGQFEILLNGVLPFSRVISTFRFHLFGMFLPHSRPAVPHKSATPSPTGKEQQRLLDKWPQKHREFLLNLFGNIIQQILVIGKAEEHSVAVAILAFGPAS